jgi:hypothetical protein
VGRSDVHVPSCEPEAMTKGHTQKRTPMRATATPTDQAVKELDRREADGLEVTMLWYSREDYASVVVADAKTGERFELALGPGDDALDVFNHPYAYAAHRGLEYGAGASAREFALAA